MSDPPAKVDVVFEDDGSAHVRFGSWGHHLTAAQVKSLREQLGVGMLTVVNETRVDLDYRLIGGRVRPGAGRDYRLELYTLGQEKPPLPAPAPALPRPISINRPISKRRPPR